MLKWCCTMIGIQTWQAVMLIVTSVVSTHHAMTNHHQTWCWNCVELKCWSGVAPSSGCNNWAVWWMGIAESMYNDLSSQLVLQNVCHAFVSHAIAVVHESYTCWFGNRALWALSPGWGDTPNPSKDLDYIACNNKHPWGASPVVQWHEHWVLNLTMM